MQHIEIGGKTLAGRQTRTWKVGMKSNVSGRKCEILRLGKSPDHASVLVRWLEPLSFEWIAKMYPMRKICEGQTQWVGRYQIEPEIS